MIRLAKIDDEVCKRQTEEFNLMPETTGNNCITQKGQLIKDGGQDGEKIKNTIKNCNVFSLHKNWKQLLEFVTKFKNIF